MQFMPCVNRQIVNKFPFAYRPKASNYVVCHLFSLRSTLGFRRRSSPVSGSMVCLVLAIIFTFPPNLPLGKGGYKLGEQLSKHSPCVQIRIVCYGVAGIKYIFDFQMYSRFTSLPLGGRVPLSAQKRVAPQDNPIKYIWHLKSPFKKLSDFIWECH